MKKLLIALLLILPVQVLASDIVDSLNIGAGLRSAYTEVKDEDSSDFNVQSVRLYIDGQFSEKVKFTLNTECEGCAFGKSKKDISILDAIVRFELNDSFNLWIGRMLTPADRIEMNGPYYALSWNQYTVPLLPSDQLGQAGLLGRDEGVTVWGKKGKFQYAAGLFNGVEGGPNQDDNLLFAGRVAYNFLDMEQNPGYYTSSTYFGKGGDIFTVGLSYQSQADGTGTVAEAGDFEATILDVLFEKPLGGGAVTLEGEYKMFDADLSAAALADPACFCLFDGESYFVTAAYLFPLGSKHLQPYIRYTSNEPDFIGMEDSDLVEIGVNYIIKGHNLRFNFNTTDGDANLTGTPGADVQSFSLGVQVQI